MTVAEDHEAGGRRDRILDAAAIVISRRGADAARLADIAEEAGISLSLVQYYFRHRERLFEAVFRREAARIDQTWRAAVSPDAPPLDRLVEYLRLCTPAGSSDAALAFGPGWAFWVEFWSKAHRDPQVRDEVGAVYAGFTELFSSAIEAGVASAEFTPVDAIEDIVDRLVSQIDGSAVRTLLGSLDGGRMLTLLVNSLARELGLSEAQTEYAHARARRRRRAPARVR